MTATSGTHFRKALSLPSVLAFCLLVLLAVGCVEVDLETPAPRADVFARAAQIEALLDPVEYQTTLAVLGHFREEIGRTPFPDSGGTDRASRQQTGYFFIHTLARAFLLGVEDDPQYAVYRREVAEFMLKQGWMTRAHEDSIDVFYLRHAVAGFSPDIDRVVQTLDRLGPNVTSTETIVREALLNLEAWSYLLSDEGRSRAVKSSGLNLAYGEAVSPEAYLRAVPDNRTSLLLYLDRH